MENRPKSIERWSPNFTPKDPGRKIACVVIHATVGAREPSLQWMCNPESKVSAHYLVDKIGGIFHLVHEQNLAWHAGESTFEGQTNVNAFSVGIELENANDGKDPYPSAQLESCADLVSAICNEHGIHPGAVVSHASIALPAGRKTDPAGFPWSDFYGLLRDRGLS